MEFYPSLHYYSHFQWPVYGLDEYHAKVCVQPFLFIVYLMIASATQPIQYQMIGLGLIRIWKWSWLNIIAYIGTCLQGLRKTMRKFSLFCSWDLNWSPLEHKLEVLQLETTCSVVHFPNYINRLKKVSSKALHIHVRQFYAYSVTYSNSHWLHECWQILCHLNSSYNNL